MEARLFTMGLPGKSEEIKGRKYQQNEIFLSGN
jgi:hypothetical protein